MMNRKKPKENLTDEAINQERMMQQIILEVVDTREGDGLKRSQKNNKMEHEEGGLSKL